MDDDIKGDIRSPAHVDTTSDPQPTTNSGCPSLMGEDTPQKLEPRTDQPQQKPWRNVAVKNMSKHFDGSICWKWQTCNSFYSLRSITDHSIKLLWGRGWLHMKITPILDWMAAIWLVLVLGRFLISAHFEDTICWKWWTCYSFYSFRSITDHSIKLLWGWGWLHMKITPILDWMAAIWLVLVLGRFLVSTHFDDSICWKWWTCN
jgi:hypothetical protein